MVYMYILLSCTGRYSCGVYGLLRLHVRVYFNEKVSRALFDLLATLSILFQPLSKLVIKANVTKDCGKYWEN